MSSIKPALFISALEPGHTGGGALCTLAYIQALSIVHERALTYIGPEFTNYLYFPGVIKKKIFVPKRKILSKIITLIQLKSADRLSPFVEKTVRPFIDEFEIVYINDERAGRFAIHPYFRGKRIVSIFHNYRADYQKSNDDLSNPIRRITDYINVKNSNIAYKYSSFRIFLTEYDRKRYHELMLDKRLNEKSNGNGYFGTCDGEVVATLRKKKSFHVAINASLGRGHNAESVLYFLENIWPRVVNEEPQAQLIIAGRAPDSRIKRVAQKAMNTALIADPTVEEMEKLFSKTAVCICTNLEGSGIKLRVAEALRRGIPAICSRHCAIGYENIDSLVLKVYSSPEQCVSHVLSFLSMKSQEDIMKKCLDEYKAKLSFNAGIQKLMDQLIANNIL